MKTRIIIPARLKSTRFPNKLIKVFNGKSIIEHVALRAKKLNYDSLLIATDSLKIKKIVENIGIQVWFCDKEYSCGTERLSALSKDLNFKKNDIIINIQGDEYNFPLIAVKNIINDLKVSRKEIVSTVIYTTIDKKLISNKDSVKVVVDKQGNALYFSRSIIPHGSTGSVAIHIGIYGYKARLLDMYSSFLKSDFEKTESLEQLRFLYNKVPVHCIKINNHNSISINSINDLKSLKAGLK
ncbi:MAG: 3-deoxy-manno-octulosonate cytidylyltransferase [Gammaproteobacteria bacterium]|nr:3-deoxy-manno-octulosonate cytidylyltransferase [Gammaproteobacteria bacterium]MBT5406133.1 3-deoxy-manno-octulosonate cytidylyltransferase [Gammaproteobacteria bacterium]MBT5644280.1 3-deoxy-manno-octulosonate cytidylyltransferase [Gammaproteobacteria bacterium]MBT5863914.1 3-deoxy-manno-octulosonate cytidylyltransferase [Gammaproteobacteria bacterium]MBT6733806.1 3-deoxy-manno-octulosonate cytidylyltransferase [Gammaproteobacteria bacterium]|tara:strand:- start:12467 stop:13186 length:720 start_codon:yes stop_codon:yes gene_type:complete